MAPGCFIAPWGRPMRGTTPRLSGRRKVNRTAGRAQSFVQYWLLIFASSRFAVRRPPFAKERKMWRPPAGAGAQTAVMIVGTIALLLWASPGHAQSGPFAGLAGSWSGSGTIGTSNGERDRIRCRASYAVNSGGNSLRQSLRCASDSYRFDLGTDVSHAGGDIHG